MLNKAMLVILKSIFFHSVMYCKMLFATKSQHTQIKTVYDVGFRGKWSAAICSAGLNGIECHGFLMINVRL